MATYSSTFNTGYKIIAEVTTKSQNVTNNYSEVNIKTYIQSTGSSYTISSSVQKGGTIIIGQSGQKIYYNGGNFTGPVDYGFWCYVGLSGNQKKLLNDVTFTCYHNSDGSISIPISVSVNIAINFSSGYRGTVSCSGTYSPSKIGRASTFSLNTSSVTLGSTNVTVSISRASSSYTHKVYYQIQNSSHNAWLVNDNSSVGTSISFTPGVHDSQHLPNSTSGTAKITVDTYSGSTWIGSNSKTITVYVPSSEVPTISNYTVTEVGGNAGGKYIKGRSSVKISYSCSAGNGASITSKNTTITGLSSNSNTSFTSAIFSSAGTKTITTTVTNSRGQTATKTTTITVIDANPPSFSINVQRCKSNGTVDDTQGTYLKITFSFSSYDTNINSSAPSWKIRYIANTTGSSWYNVQTGTGTKGSTTIITGSGGVSTEKTYSVEMSVTDSVGTYTKTVAIPRAFSTIDFKSGGKGICFGGIATLDDTFEVNMHGQFNQPLKTTRGTYCHVAGTGTGGTDGYLKVATINIIGTYPNSPLHITFSRRKDVVPKELIIVFESVDSTNPNLQYFYIRGTTGGNAYIYKSATGQWDLYIKKNESWDNITITEIKMSDYLADRININWKNELVSSLPSGYVSPTAYNAILMPESGQWWNNGTPVVGTNGVMEIGKFIDFHFTNDSTADYDSRIRIGETGNCHFTGGVYPHATNTVRLGNSSYRWDELYLRLAPNVSSDRSMKENIVYVKSKKAKSELVDETVTYEDMYNFVKDDLELATYNFINSEEQKMNFIAQDLLVNADGTDNKVGQMIVNPIASPTEEEIVEAKSHLEEDEVYTYPTLSYDMSMYVSVLAGALKTALNKIDELEEQVKSLQNNGEK